MRPRKPHSFTIWLLACGAALSVSGCRDAPGKPAPGSGTPRPEQVLDFATLYGENCAACHGANGRNGAAISLANPTYLAIAGVTNIQRVTAAGVAGTSMPPFGKAAGGMLTDQQIAILAQRLVSTWGNPSTQAGQNAPAYASSSQGNAAQGEKDFGTFCARCHGVDGSGAKLANGIVTGSLIDPAYLALIGDQGLRSIIIAGQTEQGLHDWRSYLIGAGTRPMTDQEVTDVVAWLTSHRVATPGQVYRQQQ
jgi:mono/diheme cytochrome c family protein